MRIGEFISTPDKLPWTTAGVSVTEKPINPPAVPFPEHTQPFKSLQPFVSGKLSSAHSRHSPYCNSIAKCNLSSQLGQHSFVFDNIVLWYCVACSCCGNVFTCWSQFGSISTQEISIGQLPVWSVFGNNAPGSPVFPHILFTEALTAFVPDCLLKDVCVVNDLGR